MVKKNAVSCLIPAQFIWFAAWLSEIEECFGAMNSISTQLQQAAIKSGLVQTHKKERELI